MVCAASILQLDISAGFLPVLSFGALPLVQTKLWEGRLLVLDSLVPAEVKTVSETLLWRHNTELHSYHYTGIAWEERAWLGILWEVGLAPRWPNVCEAVPGGWPAVRAAVPGGWPAVREAVPGGWPAVCEAVPGGWPAVRKAV